MRIGDLVGWLGIAVFVAGFFVRNGLSNILGLLGMGLLILATFVGSRKWLIPIGVISLLVTAMYVLMLHRD
jgi:hypothetical protein